MPPKPAQRLVPGFAVLLLAGCVGAPPSATVAASADREGVGCTVRVEEIGGFWVVIVRPAVPRLARRRVPFKLAMAQSDGGKLIALTPRLQETVESLKRDPQLGQFLQDMADDPEVSYYLWEGEVHRNGGGRTTNCRADRFDIMVDIDYHVSQEGRRCFNPQGSGNLRSLLAHEMGHAWAWRWYGNDDDCDNGARGNMTAVAWENTQLAGDAQRLFHNPPGCGCDR
jgi:hypothetical protein